MLYKDRVKETTTTTGTGNITTAGAVTGFITFNTAFGTGASNTFQYVIDSSGGSEWEVGVGYMSASTTLVRSTILASSNSGSAVNFSAGAKNVRCTAPANFFESYVIRLLSSTTISLDVGTKQTLFTVPTGKKCVLNAIILRAPSGDVSGYVGNLSFGFNAGANDWKTLGSEYVALLTSTKVLPYLLDANNLGDAVPYGSATDVFGCITSDTTTTEDIVIDLFGYLYNA